MIAEIVLRDAITSMDQLGKEFPPDMYETTARALLAQPNNRNILLFTGFALEGKQETDGPLGTYFLAKALFALGYYPIIISDYYCKDFFDQAEQNFETLMIPVKGFGEKFMYGKIIETYDPVAMISIGRPGRSENGHYYNVDGVQINGQNAPLDQFFLEETEILTIGIGDSAHEIGMGRYQNIGNAHTDNLHSCKILTDHSLVASTSSFASFGLITAISKGGLFSENELRSYYEYISSLGAVDRLTGLYRSQVVTFGIDHTLEVANILIKMH